MIHADGLGKKFNEFLAVDNIHLDVAQGRVLVLLGPNGSGKTTTVRMLTSILTPTSGWAKVAGYDVVCEPQKVRQSVGVLTEQHGLYGRMNAEEYLEFFGRLYGLDRANARSRFLPMLEKFDLSTTRKKRIGEYSKGMRQKLALVRAMMHNPPVLLLDEPTSAMDPESARTVRDAIKALRSGDRTILLCTHNMLEAEELADQVAIIRRGRILLCDSPENVKKQLLGTPEYLLTFSHLLDGWKADLPNGVKLMEHGKNWLRLRILNPPITNPELIRCLVAQNLDVVTLQEVAYSLEQAYMEVVREPDEVGDV